MPSLASDTTNWSRKTTASNMQAPASTGPDGVDLLLAALQNGLTTPAVPSALKA
jgi:hypothetical protein